MNVPVRQSGQAFDIIHTGFADIASLKGDVVIPASAKGTVKIAVAGDFTDIGFCCRIKIAIVFHSAASSYFLFGLCQDQWNRAFDLSAAL